MENSNVSPHHYTLRTSIAPAKVVLWAVAVSNGFLAAVCFLRTLDWAIELGRSDHAELVVGGLAFVIWFVFWTWLAVVGLFKVDQLRAECLEAYGMHKPE